MIGYGMLYAAAVGLPILLAAVACAAALRRYGRSERGVWLVALGLALTLPFALLIKTVGGASSESSGVIAEVGVPALSSGTLPETGVLGLPSVVTLSVEPSGLGLGLDQVVVLAWLLASVFLTLRWAVAAYRLARVGSSWRTANVDGVSVWLTADLGPAVSGVLRTRILVPPWLASLPEAQRSLVLLHEEEHVRARDPLLLAISRIARILAPWNPVVWRLSSGLVDAVELDCDRRVLRHRPDIEIYGDALLTVSARESSPLMAAAFTESDVPLRKRIVAMTTPRRSVSVLPGLAALALGVVLMIGSFEVPVPMAVEREPQDNMVRILVDVDGVVRVNDEPYPMGAVSAVVAAFYAVPESPPVTSIWVDRRAPSGLINELKRELVAGGVVRVFYEEMDSSAASSFPEAVSAFLERVVGMLRLAAHVVYETLASQVVWSSSDGPLGTVASGLPTVEPLISGERLTQMTRELQQAEDSLESFLLENRSLSPSSALQFEHDRLLRAVAVRQERLTSLAQALKSFRVEKARDMPVVPQQGEALVVGRDWRGTRIRTETLFGSPEIVADDGTIWREPVEPVVAGEVPLIRLTETCDRSRIILIPTMAPPTRGLTGLVRLRLRADGWVDRVELIQSTGDPCVDRMITGVAGALWYRSLPNDRFPAPLDLIQPITWRVVRED